MPIATTLAEMVINATPVSAPPDLLVIVGLVAAVLAIAFAMNAGQNRRPERDERPRLCRSCALSHPPFANYCRRCGRRL